MQFTSGLPRRVARNLGREHLVADLSSVFGSLTLALLSIGVYGTLAFAVVGRTWEIGVCFELGAKPGAAISMALRQIAVTVAIAIASLLECDALVVSLRRCSSISSLLIL